MPKRIDSAKAVAHDQLAVELKEFGVEVDAVLVRRYVYADDKYQQLIEGRKIKDQTVFLREAEAKSAIEERKRDTIIAEGKANVEVELQRGASEVQAARASRPPTRASRPRTASSSSPSPRPRGPSSRTRRSSAPAARTWSASAWPRS